MRAMCRTLAEGLDHPEGVAWSDEHGLFAGGESGQIYRIDLSDGAVTEVANTGGFALGMAFGPDGRLMVCDMVLAEVVAVDVLTGRIDRWSQTFGIPLTVPNHLVYMSDGTLFISDSGDWDSANGRIIRVHPNGPHRVVADGGGFTNGLAVDPAETAVYAVESSLSRVVRYDLGEEDLGPAVELISLSRTVPDGLAFTRTGELLVSCYRPDAVYLRSQDGAVTELVNDWTGLALAAPSNIAFAGPDRRTLVSANLGANHLTIIECDLVGATLPFTEPNHMSLQS